MLCNPVEASALTVTVVVVLFLFSLGVWVIAVASLLRFFRAFIEWREADRNTGRPWYRVPNLYFINLGDFWRMVRAEEPDDGLSVARKYFVRFVLGVFGFIGLVWLTVGLTTVFD